MVENKFSSGVEISPTDERIRSRTFSLQMDPRSTYLGRSYVGSFISPSEIGKAGDSSDFTQTENERSRSVHGSVSLHQQTALLSQAFDNEVGDSDILSGGVGLEEDTVEPFNGANIGMDIEELDEEENNNEDTPELLHEETWLVPVTSPNESLFLEYGSIDEESSPSSHYISIARERTPGARFRPGSHYEKASEFLLRVLHYFPSVGLGLLLNILDALSYGMIIFPITEPLFSHLGPTGLSMFYVSTVICQLCFSLGLSSFRSGVGSEMIEITPFFHTMALSIMNSIPEGNDDQVISTTIVCYALSSIITGLTFFLLGKMRLGKIVGFFPRHILIGCIGGVGYFLVITGLEICTRVAKFSYSWDFLLSLFTQVDILAKWVVPVGLTLILVFAQSRIRNSLVLPLFYITTLLLFHFIVAIVPSLSLDQMRDSGWIFGKVASNENWYDFYKYYNFKNIHWNLIPKQLPTMLALTFFGILHVPINVPALAMSLNVDRYDVDKELIAHGYSNFISGCLGSIQNYLVYTNSLLFIRAGADSPIAGIMLTIGTFIVMVIGPVIISVIPICIVSSLIFLLGYELLQEAVIDTWGKLSAFEYLTIIIIVVTMGAVDFVVGILVGILLACFSFLVDSTKLQTINGEYNGTVAKSTVHRDYIQSKFLRNIGEQIYVLKLQNVLFFGTILSIEEKINHLLEISDLDSSKKRIKYLILDFKNIQSKSIDYSAAEGFNRIKRFLVKEKIHLIISSIDPQDQICISFDKIGLLSGVELFEDLNGALEWCENEFLSRYKKLRNKTLAKKLAKLKLTNKSNKPPINTPRNSQFVSEVRNIYSEELEMHKLNSAFKERQQLLPVLLLALRKYRTQIMSDNISVRNTEIDLWKRLIPYFRLEKIPQNTRIEHNNNIFFIVEDGVVNLTHLLVQGKFYESMSSKTAFGIVGAGVSNSSIMITTEIECFIRIIDSKTLNLIKSEDISLYTELILTIMAINKDMFRELLGYSLISM